MKEYIDKHVASGAFQGPYMNVDDEYSSSPLGAFEKDDTGRIRVIHDMSWPAGNSVNDCIEKDKFFVSYSSVKNGVKYMVMLG